jgi:condensin complex subunit 1
MMGVRKMLSLIFSRETSVQSAVVTAYKRLYIESATNGNKTNPVQLVRNLTALVSGANIGDLTGLEELIGMLVKSKDLDKNCFQVMWQMFTKVMPETTNEQSRAALTLLGMVGNIEPQIITSNINVLVEHGLGERGEKHFRLAHDTFATILKIATATKTSSTDSEPPFKFPHDHELFIRLEKLLGDGISRLQDDQYIPMAQQAIAVLYKLSEYPDTLATRLIKRLADLFLPTHEDLQDHDNNVPTSKDIGQEHLKRLVFVVGHIALCQLNYLDVLVFNELKRRNNLREQKKEKDTAAKKKGPRKSKGGSTSNLETPRGTNKGKDEDDDMDVIGAQADDEEQDFIRKVCEQELLSGDNLLGLFAPLIKDICSSPLQYPDPQVI